MRIHDVRSGTAVNHVVVRVRRIAELVEAQGSGGRVEIREARGWYARRVEEAEKTRRFSATGRRQKDRWDLSVVQTPRGANNRRSVGRAYIPCQAYAWSPLLPVVRHALRDRDNSSARANAGVGLVPRKWRLRLRVPGAVPAQTVGEGEARRDLPLVLHIEPDASLPRRFQKTGLVQGLVVETEVLNESERDGIARRHAIHVVEVLERAEIVLAGSPSEEPVVAVAEGVDVTAELDVVLSERISKAIADLNFGVGSGNRQVVTLSDDRGTNQVRLLAGAIGIAVTSFARQVHAEFVHLPAQHRIQGERAAYALVNEILGRAERNRRFILPETAGEAARVVPGSVDARAEVIGLVDLPIVVSQDRKQVLELIVRAVEIGQGVHSAVAGIQERLSQRSEWCRKQGG